MDFSTLTAKANALKDAAFYPAADTALILATIAVVCQTGSKAITRFQASTLAQCCYALLFALSFIQCTDWSNVHFPLSVGLFSLLTLHPSGYYPFQLTNLLGVYRSLNGNIGGDIWYQVFYASMHAYLLVTNLDSFGQSILNDMHRLVFYTQERRLISLRKTRDIALDDLDELPERMRMSSIVKELKYDVNESAFVLRAIFRYAWRPMLPIYIIDALLGIATVAISILNTRILYFMDTPSAYKWYEGYGILFLGLFADMFMYQINRIQLFLVKETERVVRALEHELFRLPLQNTGLQKAHTIRNANMAINSIMYYIRSLQSIIGDVAGAITVIVTIYNRIGWLIIVPFLVKAAISLVEWMFQKLLGEEYQWTPFKSWYYFSVNIEEIFHNIKSIKMFGWEKMYVDPELQKHWQIPETVRVLPWYAPVVRLSWKALGLIRLILSQLYVYLVVHLYTATSTESAHAISSADMFQLDMLIRKLMGNVFSLKWRISLIHTLVEKNYMLEKALRGDFVNSVARYALGSVEGEKELDSSKPSVAIEDCDFSVSTDKSVLESISFSAQDGELVAVVGKTGSGKSSLLLSICGEVEKTKGTGAVFGTIAYMEQEPIIIDETVRDNILFGRKYDKEHYNRVIEACALTEDINAWIKGDRSVIGDRGMKISGGQRARLALARTIYSKADIYVLDDPLSSVDVHVKRHILDNVIMDSGLLGGKLRILTVNSEKLLPYFNQVIRLDEGKAVVTKQVPQTYQPLTTDFNHAKISVNDADNTELTNATETAESNQQMTVTEHPDDTGSDSEAEPDNSFGSKSGSKPDIREWSRWSNIKYVVSICGISSLVVVTLTGFINPVFGHVMDVFKLDILNSNASNTKAESSGAVLNYLRVNMLKRILHDIINKIEMYISDSFSTTQLETRINSIFADNLIHAPLSFFDSTTSADLASVYDSKIGKMSSEVSQFFMRELSYILNISLSLYRVTRNAPLLLLTIPLVIWYNNVQESLFGPIWKSLGKIQENVSIKSHKLKNIIYGGERLIRLLNVEPYFTKLNMEELDINSRVSQTTSAINSLSGMLYSVTDKVWDSLFKICILVQNSYMGHRVSSSGFVAYESLIQVIIRNVTSLIKLPKRIQEFSEGIDVFRHYMDMERDDGSDADTVEPPSNWPSSGKIELRNFSMKYHEDLEYVLKDISLTINSGERIGIVGRTGAGKTSLSRAIFRLVNKKTCEGSIIIDGCNISTIKPSILRPKLGTIPQESTMFEGPFKQNLDPLVEYTIEDMWAALIKANMVELVEPKRDRTKERSGGLYSDYDESVKKEIADWDEEWQKSGWMKRVFLWIFVRKPKLPNRVNEKAIYGLDRSIDDYDRFSNGQKQLFSLCRLLMRKRKVIVLDEATADVDLETDKEMQKLFRSEFKDSTVLTIAHRLETIMNSDRIIVMDKGRAVEFGPPKELIDQGGYFSELVKVNEF